MFGYISKRKLRQRLQDLRLERDILIARCNMEEQLKKQTVMIEIKIIKELLNL